MSEDVQPPARRKRGKGVPQEELELRFPSLKHLAAPGAKRAWVAAFNARPDAMHSLLADFIKQVHAQPGKIGQRPMPKEEQVDFESLLWGEENYLPLVQVLPKLVKVSERAFCQQIAMSRAQYQRMLRGEYDPTVHQLRIIAKAINRPPMFFLEYRKAMAIAAFVNLIDERPGIATSLYRQHLQVRMKEV